MDMGIYSRQDERFNEVEENLSWTMRFPSGIVASCNTTYGANRPGFHRVHRSKGMLHMEPCFPYQGQHLTARRQGRVSVPARGRSLCGVHPGERAERRLGAPCYISISG
jgi:predicted dehydrogenase